MAHDKDEGTKPYRLRHKQLRDDQASYRTHWKEIAEYVTPRKGRYLDDESSQVNDGSKKHDKIINAAAIDALRTTAAGMQGGLASPTSPWFVLTLSDKELMEFGPVKEWLRIVRDILLDIFAQSNFYGSIHGMYREIAAFGVGAMLIEEDFATGIRCRPFTIGEYSLGLDSNYRPDSIYRKISMSARQLVEKFGEDSVTENVKKAASDDQSEKRFDVDHAIEPNQYIKSGRKDLNGMEYGSCYYELQAEHKKFLRKSGYEGKPFVAGRWDVTAVDTYGECPGMDLLGDIKQIQVMERDKLKAIGKAVDPPMNAPTELKGKGTLIRGGVNYYDSKQGGNQFVPAQTVSGDVRPVSAEIDKVERRVQRIFYNDLFRSVLGEDKNMTATEVAQRHAEKLILLGPVIGRLDEEVHDPSVERTYGIAASLGMLPPPPKELDGITIKIKYISMLAQAQRLVGTSGIEQVTGFVGNLSTVSPEVLDKLNLDETIDQYASMVGVPPNIIRTDEEVLKIRQSRAEQIEKERMQQQIQQLTDTAKTLSETETGKDSALDQFLEGAQP